MTEDFFIKEGVLFDGQYKLLKMLSTSGGSADVWLALDKNAVDLVAESEEYNEEKGEALKVVIKIYRPKNALDIEGEQRFRDEFKIVYNCHHENLLQSTYFSICNDRPYLVMPFCQQGSTETLIRNFKSDAEIWRYIYDVSSGIAYLHNRKPPIIHQDIKPANILINDDGRYAITDFGISAQSGHQYNDLFEESCGGTMAYMAPERFLEEAQPNAASDVWALGATFYEMITGCVPFGEEGGSVQNLSTALPQIKEKVDKDIKKLICSCLDFNAEKRPSAKEIHLLAKRKIEKKRGRKFIAVGFIVALLLTIILAMTLSTKESAKRQFEELRASGDSIVDIIKEEKILNDTLKVRLSQAKALYEQSLIVEIDDAESKDATTKKIAKISSLQEHCKKWEKAKEKVENAISLGYGFENVVDEREAIMDSIEKTINKKIDNL